jgi:hypothetical protein
MKTKKIMSLVLAMLMLASLLCACAETQGDNTPGATTTTPTSEADNKALYQVTVIDVYGKPATSGVAVRFLQNGESVAMQTMNAAGVAEQELEKGGAVGRKLDFIAQEMNREANTILSKSGDLITSDIAIELKTTIEKVREQIQNVE